MCTKFLRTALLVAMCGLPLGLFACADWLPTKFELVNGMVVVQAEIDGVAANFILDTGSPMMILNDSTQVADSLSIIAGPAGNASGHWKKIEEFSWAGVRRFNIQALGMDLRALERATGKRLRGLIGYRFIENFDLVLDFENQFVTLLPQGIAASQQEWKLKSKMGFEIVGHLPVVVVKIGDVAIRLGLDTGANTNLLNINRLAEIDAELVTPVKVGGVMGIGSGALPTKVVDIVETNVAGTNYWNMRYIVCDISHLPNLANNGVDGLLGFPFFQSKKFVINYSSQTLSVWE